MRFDEAEHELLVLLAKDSVLGRLGNFRGVLSFRFDRILLSLNYSEVGSRRRKLRTVDLKLAFVQSLVSLVSCVEVLGADDLLEVLDQLLIDFPLAFRARAALLGGSLGLCFVLRQRVLRTRLCSRCRWQ